MANLFICPFEHELVSALAIVSRIPFNDSEDILKLLRDWEYVGSSPTMVTKSLNNSMVETAAYRRTLVRLQLERQAR